jgi:hypothetical protein
MALAFCASRPFMGSTSVDQCAGAMAAAHVTLTEGIAAVRRRYPMPI